MESLLVQIITDHTNYCRLSLSVLKVSHLTFVLYILSILHILHTLTIINMYYYI